MGHPAASDDDSSDGTPVQPTSVAADLNVAARYVAKNTARDRRGFAIGLATVLVLVTFVCLLENSIKKSPVIFMRLSENSVGEYDLVLSPLAYNTSVSSSAYTAAPTADWLSGSASNSSSNSSSDGQDLLEAAGLGSLLGSMFLNWSKYDALLGSCAAVNSSVPRWMMLGTFAPADVASEPPNTSAVVLVMNDTLERAVGLGRNYHFAPLGDREAVVSRTLLTRMGMDPHARQRFVLSVDWLSLMSLTSDSGGSSSGGSRGEMLFDAVVVAGLGIDPVIDVNYTVPLTEELVMYLQGLSNVTGNITLNRTQAEAMYDEVAAAAEREGIYLVPFNDTELGKNFPEDGDVGLSFALPDMFPWLRNLTFDGDRAVVRVHRDLRAQYGAAFDDLAAALVFNETFTAVGGIESSGGKYPSSLGNVVLLDADALQPYVRAWLAGLGRPVRTLAANMSAQLADVVAALRELAGIVQDNATLEATVRALSDTIAQLDRLANSTAAWGADFQMAEHAMTVVAQLRERETAYMLGVSELKDYILHVSDDLSNYIGFNESVSFTTPVADSIGTYEFFRLFIDQIFLFILIVMLFLGACLVFSLLLSDVEAKTYEYGMLRALGMKQYVLAELLSIQSLMFSVPGILLGILLGWVFYTPIAAYISTYTMLSPDLGLNVVAWVLALCMGFLMPIVANVVPIKRALSSTLRDALDIYHKAVQAVSVTVKRLQDVGINRSVLILSVLVVVLGLGCYYLIPISFVESNMSLFFTVFIVILVLFLFGLSMLATIVQPYLESALLYVLVWGRGRAATRALVRKNLSGHHTRNSKTSLMLTTSLAFIIFAGSVFTLLGSSLKDFSRLSYAADIVVMSLSTSAPVDEASMTRLLDAEIARPTRPLVRNYTYVTFPLRSYSFVRSTQISNLGDYPRRPVSVQAVEQHYVAATFGEFYRATELARGNLSYVATPEHGRPDAIDSLYRHRGQQQLLPLESDGIAVPEPPHSDYYASAPYRALVRDKYTSYIDVVVSEALRTGAAIDTSTPLILRLRYYQENSTDTRSLYYMCKARAMLESLEGFSFSRYKSMEYASTLLVTMDAYQHLLEAALAASRVAGVALPATPAKQRLLVRLAPDVTEAEREQLMNALHVYINNDLTTVSDTKGMMKTMDTTLSMLNIFFLVVAIIAGLLCFFVLWLSFTANVNENSWEFAVLRSVGITAARVISLYVYEAFAIVLACVILGTLIGLVVAIMMTVQFGMFTQLPFSFQFPSVLFFPVLAMCLIIAFVGSYIPASVIRRKPISSVLKGM